MTDIITITGVVATTPRHIVTTGGLAITSFRLASTQRRFDRAQAKWVDAETNWYTVTTFRQLAVNVLASVKKGERVVATGRLRIRDWEAGEKSGTNIDVEADAVGHDLSWGTASWARVSASGTSDGAAQTPVAPHDDDSANESDGSGEARNVWAVPGSRSTEDSELTEAVVTPF